MLTLQSTSKSGPNKLVASGHPDTEVQKQRFKIPDWFTVHTYMYVRNESKLLTPIIDRLISNQNGCPLQLPKAHAHINWSKCSRHQGNRWLRSHNWKSKVVWNNLGCRKHSQDIRQVFLLLRIACQATLWSRIEISKLEAKMCGEFCRFWYSRHFYNYFAEWLKL